jgi:hypothetical protein
VDHRAGWQQRLHVVGIVVDDVPAELIVVDAVELLDLAIGINRLDALRFAAIVQVRLERGESRVPRQA